MVSSPKHRQKPKLDSSSSAKRIKNSACGSIDSNDGYASILQADSSPTCLSSSRDFETQMPLSLSLEGSCQLNGNTDSASASCASGAAGISYPSKNHNAYGSSDTVTGWMYINEQGQMSGPYFQQQLSEGLSTGFLPEELPVYPVINGAEGNAVPLKFFKLYPDHVASGFMYLTKSNSDVSVTANCHFAPEQDTHIKSGSVLLTPGERHVDQTCYNSDVMVSESKLAPDSSVFQQQCLSWEERCWLILDIHGRSNGPYPLSELYGWHQYGYLHDAVMIRHIDDNYSPIALVSLINSWKQQSYSVTANETTGTVEFISDISKEIGTQLHDCIMKAARRSVLDEIIGNVIVDFAALKKAQKQSKSENGTEDIRSSVDVERSEANAGESSCAAHAATVACHDVKTSGILTEKTLEEPHYIQKMKSIGSIENFQGANKVISQALFDYCMQVMWNAVFYEPVTSYALTWRKDKRWSRTSTEGAAALDKICTGFQKTADETTKVRQSGSPVDELDCPPGFHLILQDSSMVSHSHLTEEKLSIPDAQHCDEDTEGTIARVEEELYMSSKASMADFLKTAVEKEVFKVVKCLADGTSEVTAGKLGILCNDNSEDAALKVLQELHSGHTCLDEAQIVSQGSKASVQSAVSPHTHSSSDFFRCGFRRLGAPARTAIDDSSAEEPSLPGFTGFTIKPGPQDWRIWLLNQFEIPFAAIRSRWAANIARESDSYDFIGSAFKRMGMPISSVIDDQRTDEPLLPGSDSEPKDRMSSSMSKFRPVGLDEGIPYQKKFMVLALFRQKLHDDVLREWISSFHDDIHILLKQHAIVQDDVIIRSENLSKSNASLQPEIDLMERSKSYHSSGPSEFSVVEEVTYSRRKKVLKSSGAEPSSLLLRDFKLHHQSSTKFEEPRSSKNLIASVTAGVKNKQKAKGVLKKETGSSIRTSKVGSAITNLAKVRQSTRSLNCRKLQSATGPAQKYGVESGVPHIETASNGNKEISSCSIPKIAKKDKVAVDRFSKTKKSSTMSNLKKENVVDESLSLPPKVLKLVDNDAKQASIKKNGKTKLNNSRVTSSCPLSAGCARTSIDGWKWHKWSLHARPAERVRVRGNQITTLQRYTSDISGSHPSRVKGISARTNRVKMRNLLAAAEGAELLKTSQLKARKKHLRFQRSKIHDWGLIALEPIETEDFVIEYVGELIRSPISDIREQQYEKMGIGSSYLFRLDDGYVVDATKRGGIARFINHSCEPNCYTKIVSVDGQKRIFIYAKRHISAGEEITYNYKFPLEEKKIPCNCGSRRCRGSMN